LIGMADITKEQVLGALKAIVDPKSGKDVVANGMISGLYVREGKVGFILEVTAGDGARMEPLRKACENAVKALPGVTTVTAVLTAERPAPGQGQAGHRHDAPGHQHAPGPKAQAAQTKSGVPGIRAIIAVASGKGGVGKSTVAVNLALGLKRLGKKVGILDADIYGPSMPRLLGISGKPRVTEDKKIVPMEKYGIRVMSIGFLIEEDRATVWRGPMVAGALQQMLTDVAWGDLDVLVVDMPPGTGDAQLTLAQRVPLAGAVIVSTPQDIALIDARRGLAMFRRVEVPVFGIVENMSYFICPHCGEASEIFGHGGARETAAQLGCDFLGEVPLHIAIRETSDGGAPIVETQPDSPQAQAFMDIAAEVADKLYAGAQGGRKAPNILVQ
jgi:ATP-binding protein involved in chromosome partitioning